MPTNKSSDGKDKFSSQVFETDISQSGGSSNSRQYELTTIANSKSVASELETRSTNSHREIAQSELTQLQKPNQDQTKSIFQKLKAKTAAALVGSAVMLPILGIGTATYYFGSQAVNKQAILARRSNYTSLTETELAREQRLLAALLIGSGTTALLAGAIAALGTKRLFDSMSRSNSDAEDASIQVYRNVINNPNKSVRQQDIVKAIVEEARNYLNCDRVIVYSLNQDRDGEIVAESVAPGYTKWLGITIKDPWEAEYLDKYRNGIRAINDIDRVEITPERKEQLEAMEVKASLVTPIVSEGNLFGLLVAHQCDRPREWQKGETEFFHQLAKKTGLALKNAQLLDDMVRIQTEAETERKWTNYFTDAIQHIRASIEQDDVLDISVEEVRRVLECDRVLVYSLNQDNQYGAVIAESVSAGYPRALNKTIEDPCFEARYLDKYRDGRVRAIDNIYEAGMSGCYIEQLENLEVKANLVTPILNEGRLFGLLVAHQCSEPRHWFDYEIRWVTQIATQVGFALDNAKLLAASATTQVQAETERKWTNYFTDAIQYIRASIEQDDVLDISVEEVRRVLECDRVLVYSLNQDNQYGAVIAESVSAGYPRALNKTIEDPCFEARYLDKYRDGRVRAIDNIYEAGMSGCYIEQLENLEVKANLVTPILNEGRLFGLLVAHQCSEPRHWQDYEIRWVTQIATQVGFALDNAKLLQRSKEAGLPTQLLNNFSQGIGERVNRSELLKIAVEQARKVIQLDRVIVYQCDRDLNGDIVVESVVLGYPRALHSQIKDPCLKREYVEEYRQGRTKAIANVYRANLTIHHLEQLESLSVKASVAAPILQDGRLFGLLIGHQCQQPRSWSQSEIDLFAGLALQLGLALDRVDLKEELDAAKNAQTNETQKQLEQRHGNNIQPTEREIFQLLIENQAELRDLRAKIDKRSTANDLTASHHYKEIASTNNTKREEVSAAQRAIQRGLGGFPAARSADRRLTTTDGHSPVQRLYQEAIAEATKKVEVLNQSQQNLHQMVNIINELKERIDCEASQRHRSSAPINEPPQLPIKEITIESSEAVLEPIDSYDYDIETITEQTVSEAAPSSLSMNQFVSDITDLSEKISQQSLIVTDSFQKLAEFAQQLSERKKP